MPSVRAEWLRDGAHKKTGSGREIERELIIQRQEMTGTA